MRISFRNAVVVASIVLVGCPRSTSPVPSAEERFEVAHELEAFRDWWLRPARVAPPVIGFEPLAARGDRVTARARPLRPEDASWNQWRGDELRLFNNRAAYLFEVDVRADGVVRWLPGESWVRLNTDDEVLRPAGQPDELLLPLMQAALDQERWVLDGDLVERTRGAGAFRTAYLPVSTERGELHGLVAFPLPDPDRHVISVELGLAVQTDAGRELLVWHYD